MGKGWRTKRKKCDDSCPIELPRGWWGGKLDPEVYTCFKIETRISFSRIIIKEEEDFQTYFQQMENKEQGGEGARIYVQLSSRSFEFLLFGQFFRFRSSLRWERRLSFSLTETKVSRIRCKRSERIAREGRKTIEEAGMGERGCNDALWSIRRRVTWAEVNH